MRKVFCRCFDISATLHQDLRENFDTNVKTQKCIEVSSPLFCRSKVSIVNILNIVTILNIVKFVTILNIVNIVTILNIVNIVNIMPHLLDEIKLTQLSRKVRKKARFHFLQESLKQEMSSLKTQLNHFDTFSVE